MDYILELNNVTKQYAPGGFQLKDISFRLPYGAIMGLVGENGAGKSTTIGCILNTLFQDSGTISVFGQKITDENMAVREDIGVVFDTTSLPGILTPHQLSKVMGGVYSRWDPDLFFNYLQRFRLPRNKKIKTLSKGMAMKLSIAAALCHHPRLLILDEPTSGLDPIMRDDMLDIFLDFVQEEDHAILLSSHITGDLEKISDYITFIHDGQVLLSEQKDHLMYDYAVVRCKASQFAAMNKEDMIAFRKRDFQIDVLMKNRKLVKEKYGDCIIDSVTIDEILLLIVKGEHI